MKIISYLTIVSTLLFIQSNLCAQEADKTPIPTFEKFIGGSLFLRSEIRDKSQLNNVFYEELAAGVNPYLGFTISNRFSAGGFITYDYRKLSFNSTSPFQEEEYRITSNIGGGLFIRNYLNDGALRFFFESQLYYSRSKTQRTGPLIDIFPTYQNVLAAGISPAVSYSINRVRLIASFGSLSYSNYSDATFGEDKTVAEKGYSTILLSLRPRNIGFGAEYLF